MDQLPLQSQAAHTASNLTELNYARSKVRTIFSGTA